MDLEDIKQKKLQELMQKQEQSQSSQDEMVLKKQISILESHIRRFMTKDAYLRYTNLKLAHKDLSIQILVLLNQALQTNQIKQINDNDFKDLLKRLHKNNDIKIIRK